MMTSVSGHVLVATLGSQPHIITFTLDILLQLGYPISDVLVIHPSTVHNRRVHRSLTLLQEQFQSHYLLTAHPVHFHSLVLQQDEQGPGDLVDDIQVNGALRTLLHLLRELKEQHIPIHLSVTGGRRLLGLLATAAASFLLDYQDHIWHTHLPEAIRTLATDGALMHAPPDTGIRLIEGPFLAMRGSLRHHFLDTREQQRCHQVVQALKPAQLKVLRQLALGLRPRAVALALSISLKTVDTHKTAILRECYNSWDVPASERLDYRFLHEKFSLYFELDTEKYHESSHFLLQAWENRSK